MAASSFLTVSSVSGELLFSESFDYPAGNLDGQGPPPGSPPSVGIGVIFESNHYGLDNDTGLRGSRSVTSVRVHGSTVWLVTKLDFSTGNEYLWVDPSLETEPDIANADASLPMTAAFQAAGFPYLQLRVGTRTLVFNSTSCGWLPPSGRW